MVIYGVYSDGDGRDYKAFFTSEDDANKYAALLGKPFKVDDFEVDEPSQIKRARLGLVSWSCWARSDSAGPEYALTVNKEYAEDKEPGVFHPRRHTQWRKNPLMRPWDLSYSHQNYYIPDCDVLPFIVVAATQDDATAIAAHVRVRWLAGDTIAQLFELVKAL